MRLLNYVALTVVIIGAINWGLIGFFDFNLVSALFGEGTVFTRLVYDLVGICGLYLVSFYGLLARRDA